MDTPVVVAVAVAAVIGVLLGALGRTMWASQGMKAAQAEARRIEAEARTPEGAHPRSEGREARLHARPRKRRGRAATSWAPRNVD